MQQYRILSDMQLQQIRYFYRSPYAFVYVILIFTVPLSFSIVADGLTRSYIPSAVALLISLLLLFLRRKRMTRKIRRAITICETGDTEEIRLESLGYNWNIRLNGAPQKVIIFWCRNELMKIKTFNPKVVNAFNVPAQQAFVSGNYPGIVIPSAIFNIQVPDKNHKAPRIRNAGV